MIVTVIGARPQFIKASVLSKSFKEKQISETIIHTGQHYDYKMSQVFFDELGMPGAEINLNVGSGSHGSQTAQMLKGIEEYLLKNIHKITLVNLYGDTNSTLAGALAASKLNIPIMHIEAGLRSFNRAMPEESNRVVTDHLSSLLFCPSENSRHQLACEGIIRGVHVVGDIMLDAVKTFTPVALKSVDVTQLLPSSMLKDKFSILTIHRPVNTDNVKNLGNILWGIAKTDHKFIWPVHPRNKQLIESKINIPPNIFMCNPLSYFEMLTLLSLSYKVVTDSGGLQKEAYWLEKPCITVRDETEWVETLHNRWNILVKPDPVEIAHAFQTSQDAKTWIPLYGKGEASAKITQEVIRFYE